MDLRPYLRDAIDPTQIKRALVIKLRHHGDVLLSSPVLSALKAAAPNCEIDALVFADTAAMLDQHPALCQLHTLGRDWKKLGLLAQAKHEWGLLRQLQARKFDLVIHLTDHPRGAWLTRLIGPRWSVAPQRAGRSRWWKNSFSHQYKVLGGGRRHTVDTHLDALRRLGIQPADNACALCMVPGSEADAHVAAKLTELGVTGPFIQFHPASRWFFKCWPLQQNADLLRQLVEAGHTVVMTGAPDERERDMVERIMATAGVPAANLCGQLSLKQLAALTHRAKLFIGVDSAPMHIAAAVGTPCVALFGPSGDKEWGPWHVAHKVITSNHSCRPCGQDGCGGGKVSECLSHITVEQAFTAANALLEHPA